MFTININFNNENDQFFSWSDYSGRPVPVYLEIDISNLLVSVVINHAGGIPSHVYDGLLFWIKMDSLFVPHYLKELLESESTRNLLNIMSKNYFDDNHHSFLNESGKDALNEISEAVRNLPTLMLEDASDIDVYQYYIDGTSLEQAIDEANSSYNDDEFILLGDIEDSFIAQLIYDAECLDDGEFLPKFMKKDLIEIDSDYEDFFE